MGIHSDTGYKVSIAGIHAVATDTSAEYAALTWVEVGEVESIGEFGDSATINTFRALANTRTRKTKSTRDAGTLALTVGRDALDAGQIAVRAAQKTSFKYDFKIEASDKLDTNDTNSIFYFAALVSAAPIRPGQDAVREVYQLAIDTEVIEVPATVVP